MQRYNDIQQCARALECCAMYTYTYIHATLRAASAAVVRGEEKLLGRDAL